MDARHDNGVLVCRACVAPRRDYDKLRMREAEVAALWKIAGYDGSTVSLLQQEMGLDVGEPVVVEVQELLAEWKIYKGTVTEPLPGWNFESNPCSPLASAVWKYDYAKSAVVMAVREVFEHMYITTKDLALFVKPNAVRVSSAWKVGELMIAPASTRIERKDAPGSICVGKFDLGGPGLEPLFLAPSFANPLNAKGEPNPAPWVSPFWHAPGPEAHHVPEGLVEINWGCTGQSTHPCEQQGIGGT